MLRQRRGPLRRQTPGTPVAETITDHQKEETFDVRAQASLTALSLGAALLFGAPAKSADLPKEGTFSGTYAGAATFKIYPVGKERAVGAFEDRSVTVGKGFLDHMTWHCFTIFST